MENLKNISINNLLFGNNGKQICFIIPSYQRGYRWEKEQVEKLLDDLLEFGLAKEKGDQTVGDFYCLQPIVVKEIDKTLAVSQCGDAVSQYDDVVYYEVVDGQQRLTTVYILLMLLQRKFQAFIIKYARDKDCNNSREQCLKQLAVRQKCDNNHIIADVYYFIKTYDIASSWLDNKRQELKISGIESKMEDILTEKTTLIWYELPKDSSADCYSVFRNINYGKIPLTDSELVKAMLLNSKYFSPHAGSADTIDKVIKQEQERYARLWDAIRLSLKNDSVWAFITGNHDFDIVTHIDFLLMIDVVRQNSVEVQLDKLPSGKLKIFQFYEAELNKAKDKRAYIADVFERIRKNYRTIMDWYESCEIYNAIGYLMTYRGKTNAQRLNLMVVLQEEYEKMSRNTFVQNLKNYIKKDFEGLSLREINYLYNRKEVEKLLMIFNITECNAIGKKFNFVAGKSGWSIEHIKAQHSEIAKAADRVAFLKKELSRIASVAANERDDAKRNVFEQIEKDISDAVKKKEISDDEFMKIMENVDIEIDEFDEADMHKMGNLALLGQDDNSAFSNSPFYEKRKLMLDWLKKPEKNIPLATSNSFLKIYSDQGFSMDFTKWGKSDFNSLYLKQAQALKDYIKEN